MQDHNGDKCLHFIALSSYVQCSFVCTLYVHTKNIYNVFLFRPLLIKCVAMTLEAILLIPRYTLQVSRMWLCLCDTTAIRMRCKQMQESIGCCWWQTHRDVECLSSTLSTIQRTNTIQAAAKTFVDGWK